MKKIYSISAAVIGEALLVFVLLEFYDHLGKRLFWQNLIFLTIAYGFLLDGLFRPLVETESKEQKWVGILGLRLSGTLAFFGSTFLMVVLCNILTPINANHQALIFLAILAFFLLSRFFALMSYEKVGRISKKEESMTFTYNVMKKTMDDLYYQLLQNQSVDPKIKERVSKMKDSMRYISPIGTSEAIGLENEIKETISSLELLACNYISNKSSVDQMVLKLEGLLQRRKFCLI